MYYIDTGKYVKYRFWKVYNILSGSWKSALPFKSLPIFDSNVVLEVSLEAQFH